MWARACTATTARGLTRCAARYCSTRTARAGCCAHSSMGGFELSGSYYKRMNIPDGLDEGLKRWYPLKSFSLNHAYTQDELMSAELVARDMAKRLGLLKDVYDFMYRIRPVREEEPVEDAFHRIAGAGAAGSKRRSGTGVCLKNSLIRNFGVFCAISASLTLDLALLSLRVSSLN